MLGVQVLAVNWGYLKILQRIKCCLNELGSIKGVFEDPLLTKCAQVPCNHLLLLMLVLFMHGDPAKMAFLVNIYVYFY